MLCVWLGTLVKAVSRSVVEAARGAKNIVIAMIIWMEHQRAWR